MIDDKRYIPFEDATKGLTQEQLRKFGEALAEHPRMPGVRFHRNGKSESFDVSSSVVGKDGVYFHFAFIREFKNREGIA